MQETTKFEQLKKLFPEGKTKQYSKQHIIFNIHREVKKFRWLIKGTVDYFIELPDQESDILVCQVFEPLNTLGLNGLNAPKRYTYKAVVSSAKAIFFEVSITQLEAFLKVDTGNRLLKTIGSKLHHQLRAALLKQIELLQPVRSELIFDQDEFYMSPEDSKKEIVKLMRHSPFLDHFAESHLEKIARLAERREYEPHELLYLQDQLTNGLYILINGEVGIKRVEGNIEIQQRSIKDPGFIFGWSCFLGDKDICTAMTHRKSAIYFIPLEEFQVLLLEDSDFENQFYRQLLWLMGNQLNAAFLRYVGLLGKHNLQAVFQLIENNKSRIPLESRLHQIVHLLKQMNTKEIAYQGLRSLLIKGTSLERHIASLSLELLKDDEDEYKFVCGLEHIYTSVAAGDTLPAKEIRKQCAQATKELFQKQNYHIQGWENLPEEGGCIFIYNHLINHSHYTLNNDFQITLDSHFVSAMLLDQKYGDPGIRTVRIGRGQEYGHQNYYNRLGHINVYTKESENLSKENKKNTRSIFYSEAERLLKMGYNLIVSPEGTSYATENSPGPFKLGSFKLALNLDPEPLIVPIAMVNFDRRIKGNLFYCMIHPAFKLSDRVPSKKIPDLVNFVNSYQKEYATYIEQARTASEELLRNGSVGKTESEAPEVWRNEINRLKRRVDSLVDQESLIAFYGSSSIRLWVNMKKDVAPLNVINLGFGGSTFGWCIHYFDEIFSGLQPDKIVLYAGENDLNDGSTPEQVLTDCKILVKRIRQKYANASLAFISLKPSMEREKMIPKIIETNLLLSKYVIGELNAQFINVFDQMVTAENRPRPELYLSDGLHLNKEGYTIWSSVIKEALLVNEIIT